MTENQKGAALNDFLVGVFNEILRTEEESVSKFGALTLREMHVIEAVCAAEDAGCNSAAEIAKSLNVTAGTLTSSVTALENKGCLIRTRDEKDRRIVRIAATVRGRKAKAKHDKFHRDMVAGIMSQLSDKELNALIKGLGSLSAFFGK
ncbi:MAG: MarR family winged helix-turn-helix transcriptional regulator [Oscillospiraceae bacterium]|nr:MarR family winged helix-turn-helix transcriptional regulator [Oscillospiraceae bacterium]